MAALWDMIIGVVGSEIAMWRGYAQRRAKLYAALAFFALASVALAIALAFAGLVAWVGIYWALAISLGLALVGLLGVMIAMRIEARRHQRRLLIQAQIRRRMVKIAGLTLLPRAAGASPLVIAALGALAMGLWGGDSDQPTSPDT